MADWLKRLLLLAIMLPLSLAATGCADTPTAPPGHERVTIDGRQFVLELAITPESRVQGLSGRTEIPADGGMIFVFPSSQLRYFVMRDCPVPIDIIFLDGSGRVTMTHAMLPEPRAEDGSEGTQGEINPAYESRLTRYTSRYSAQFAIELKGGTLEEIEVAEGDLIRLDTERLRTMTK